MISRFRLMAAAALWPLALAAPAAHAQFLIDETVTVARAPTPAPAAQSAGEVGGEPAPGVGVPTGLPGNTGNQMIREVAERVVGRKRAGQVGQIEAVACDVLGKDPAGAASSVGVAEVLPLVGEVVKGLGKKKP